MHSQKWFTDFVEEIWITFKATLLNIGLWLSFNYTDLPRKIGGKFNLLNSW